MGEGAGLQSVVLAFARVVGVQLSCATDCVECFIRLTILNEI